MKFEINSYDEHHVMHCQTQEEAQAFLEFLDSIGLRWCSGQSYLESDHYKDYGSDTCYWFHDGSYGSRGFAVNDGFTILEFGDFDWDVGEPEITMNFDELFQAR